MIRTLPNPRLPFRFALPFRLSLLIAMAFSSACAAAGAQAVAQALKTSGEQVGVQQPVKVFRLANAAQVSEANEIITALRNMIDPRDKLFLLTQTNDIVVTAPPDQLTLIGTLITELDRPKQLYRVTYTINESDNGKRVGVQHFTMVVVTGQRITLKQGDKIPVLTGSYEKDNSAQQTQVTYIDIGMSFDTTLDKFANGLRLRSKVEQSSVAGPQSGAAPSILNQDPVVRQTVLEGTSVIVPGKPVTLGSVDMVGSTRHVDIEVIAEPVA